MHYRQCKLIILQLHYKQIKNKQRPKLLQLFYIERLRNQSKYHKREVKQKLHHTSIKIKKKRKLKFISQQKRGYKLRLSQYQRQIPDSKLEQNSIIQVKGIKKMQDNNQMTPIKKKILQSSITSQINDEGSNSIQNLISSVGKQPIIVNGGTSNSLGNSNNTSAFTINNKSQSINTSSIFKQSENQSDTIFCPNNDPIFQPIPSPNAFLDYKSNNSYFNSAFKATNMLASTKKPYNNNLFLTPIKGDDRRKPAYINSILKESPYFNGNNICRKLNFDDDFDDIIGNSFMPVPGIFEEKKGVFSNINMNILLMPQAQLYNTLPGNQFDLHNTSINNMDFSGLGLGKSILNPFMNASPENKKDLNFNNPDFIQNIIQQADIEGSSKKIQKNSNGNINSILEKNNDKNSKLLMDSPDFLQNLQNLSIPLITPNSDIFNSLKNQKLNKLPSTPNILIQQASNPKSVTLTPQASSISNNQKKQKTCNCKKTKCLKLYCDCFAAGELCGGECNCQGCSNTSHSDKRAGAIVSIMDRLPDAFGPKVQQNSHKKGCNCNRSGCLKKYCECYTLGINCGEYCKCNQCKNQNINHAERLSQLQNNDSQKALEIGSSKLSMNKRQQELDEIEQESSTKKKVFINQQFASQKQVNNKLQNNNSSSSNDEEDEENSNLEVEDKQQNNINHLINKKDLKVNQKQFIQKKEINEEDEGEEEESIDEEQASPNQKMYTTPLKQPTKAEKRNLTTADTVKKQNTQNQDNDTDIKGKIVKLKISEQQRKKQQQQDQLNTKKDQSQSNESEEDNQVNTSSVNMKVTNKQTVRIPKPNKITSKQ